MERDGAEVLVLHRHGNPRNEQVEQTNLCRVRKLELGGPTIKFYAPPSLYYGLKSKPETALILYEGMFPGASGSLYPKYKYAV